MFSERIIGIVRDQCRLPLDDSTDQYIIECVDECQHPLTASLYTRRQLIMLVSLPCLISAQNQ